MGRKKLSFQRISNDASRRATFKKRSQALVKKTRELATLCGVRVCILIYSEDGAQPEVWPSVRQARDLLGSYQATADLRQWNKKTSHEQFLKSRVARFKEQVMKSVRENEERETSILFLESMADLRPAGLTGVSLQELIRLREVVERKTKAVQERLQRLGVQPEQAPEEETQQQAMVREGIMEPGGVAAGVFAGNSSGAAAGPSNASASTSHGVGVIVQPPNQGAWPWLNQQIPPMA